MQTKYVDMILLMIGLVIGSLTYSHIIAAKKSSGETISSQAVKIGTITPTGKEIKRNLTASTSWATLKAPIEVYDSDTIYSGKNSTATIKLENIGELHLKGNSNLNIKSVAGMLNLTLKNGSFTLNSPHKYKFNIKVNASESFIYSSSTSQVEIEKSANKKLQMKVLAGEVSILNADNKESAHLKAPGVYTAGDENQISVNNLAAKGDSSASAGLETCSFALPKGGENTIWKTGWESLELTWKVDGKCEKFQIEISDTESFNNILWTSEAESLSTVVDKIPSGEFFYWRVKAVTKENKEVSISEVEKIVKADLIAPEITTPLQKESLYSKTNKLAKLHLKWIGKIKAASYSVELSRDEDFKQVQKTEEVKKNEWDVSDIELGTHFLRVKSKEPGRPDSPWSTVTAFSISSVPLAREVTEVTKVTQKPINYEPEKGDFKGPKITWPDVKWAEEYVIVIAEDPEFEKEVDALTTNKNEILWKDFSSGTYHYKIAAVNKKHQKSNPSAIGTIKISLEAPPVAKLGKIDDSTKSVSDPSAGVVQISWSSVPSVKFYNVELSKESKFTQVYKSEKTSELKAAFKLAESGAYFYRVFGVSKSGKPVTPVSSIEKFEFVAPTAPIAKADSKLKTEREPSAVQPTATPVPPAILKDQKPTQSSAVTNKVH